MRILDVTSGFPYPLTSGFLRHYHFIRGLSKRHEIDVLSVVGKHFRPEYVEGIRPYATHVGTFRLSTGTRSAWRKASATIRDMVFAGGTDAGGRALAAAARELIGSKRYDVILLNGTRVAPVLDHVRDTPLVIDLCDAVSDGMEGRLRYETLPRRMLLQLTLRHVRDVEARLVATGAHLLFASARDRDLVLRDGDNDRATVLPNGVDIEYWRRTEPCLGDEIVFSGGLHYPPNDDAARFLLRDIMSRVWAVDPGVRVSIVGRNPTAALRRAAAREPRVRLTGYVDDMREHLERAGVYVAPLRFGTGIQNKLLEALAMELPIITSPIAAAGLKGDDGVEPPMMVARNADEFAAEIVSTLEHRRGDRAPRRDGREFVATRFAWDEVVSTLESVLDEARRAH